MNELLKKGEDTIGRLSALKELYPESSEILTFLGHILGYQESVAERLNYATEKVSTLQEIPWEDHISALNALLDISTVHGTEEIRNSAEVLKHLPAAGIGTLLRDFISGQVSDSATRFLFLCFMQPIAASLLALPVAVLVRTGKGCPVCGFPPSVSFIQDTADVQGGRYLRCLLCRTDWSYNRTTCVSCGTNSDDNFDYFFDDKYRYITIQACKKCSSYIKIIDTRKISGRHGQVIPDLEDIASVSLDMWAEARGLKKVSANLIGV